MVGQRIHVFGTSGSGKTTLARQVASILDLPHTELDSLYHLPGWTEATAEAFRGDLTKIIDAERWVVDGNYSLVRDLLWSRADTLIWLDYPIWTCFWRVLKRSLRRGITREELWNGNRERLWVHFFSRDSLLLWVLTSHGKNFRRYSETFSSPELPGVRRVRLRSPREAAQWVCELRRAAQGST